jgi:hypothetical protein
VNAEELQYSLPDVKIFVRDVRSCYNDMTCLGFDLYIPHSEANFPCADDPSLRVGMFVQRGALARLRFDVKE